MLDLQLQACRPGGPEGAQAAPPPTARRDEGLQLAQGQHAALEKRLGQPSVEPPRERIGGPWPLRGGGLQVLDQGQALRLKAGVAQRAAPDIAAPFGVIARETLFIKRLQFARGPVAEALALGLGPCPQRGRRVGPRDRRQGRTQQPPARVAPAPRNRARKLDGGTVRREGLMAVLDAQVAPGRVGNVQALGDGAQVGAVVDAQALAHPRRAGSDRSRRDGRTRPRCRSDRRGRNSRCR
ncbi:hypothetical protein QTI27_35250 [Variovorax sp. J31P216]|nr:hypothetical protein [Variovorax sp. J31P216]MDM0029820.1 hypothetical protein [Variovorax sp. J31P216]